MGLKLNAFLGLAYGMVLFMASPGLQDLGVLPKVTYQVETRLFVQTWKP
jgi:hypothetical protein